MQLSEIELKLMAKDASKRYVEKSESLNETISKLASERKMNPHQIARVCEAANLDTYNAMWDKTGSGNFTFDVADQDKVVEKLAESSSLSPFLDEYMQLGSIKDLLPADNDVQKISKSMDSSNTQKQAAMEKTAEAVNAVAFPVTKAIKLANSLKAYIREIDSAIAEANLNRKEAECKLTDMLKVAALKGENIAAVYVAALGTFVEKKAELAELFTRVCDTLSTRGIDFKKHAKSFSEDAQGNRAEDFSAINKNHPVLKTISTVLDHNDMIPQLDTAKSYLVKKVEVLTDKITSKKFDNSGLANDERHVEDR
jgi:hypothetical protein